MPSLRYLNTILTAIAVLLTLNLWTMWTASPGGRLLETDQSAKAVGLVSPELQRQNMLQELRSINNEVARQTRLLESGRIRVQVSGAKDDAKKTARPAARVEKRSAADKPKAE